MKNGVQIKYRATFRDDVSKGRGIRLKTGFILRTMLSFEKVSRKKKYDSVTTKNLAEAEGRGVGGMEIRCRKNEKCSI